MAELHDFFATSAGAGAALIGLLFVSVSLGPEAIFGPKSDASKRGSAIGAFTAFANVFFVSLAALVPKTGLKAMIVIAFLSFVQILIESLRMRKSRPRGRWPYGVTSMAIYLFELATAIRIETGHAEPAGVVYILIGLYGYALGTSWMLLGARATQAE